MVEASFDRIIEIAKEAGSLAMAGWSLGKAAKDVWEKVPGHIVSSVDLAVNDLLKKRLETLLPEAGWLSEETADNKGRLAKDLLWVVDPIDGTKDFVKGKKGWAVSIALVKAGRPIFGVLDAPAMEETWVGMAGAGATLNGQPLKASVRQIYEGSRIPIDTLDEDTVLTKVWKPNSIALRMAMVASNRADLVATIRWGHEWDIAAADLIAVEAGAVATDALGAPLRYNSYDGKAFGVLCCAPDILNVAVDRLSSIARDIKAQTS